MGRFSAQVSSWVRETKERQTAVFRIAVQSVADDMLTTVHNGGNMPIDTGNLRRSLRGSTSAMPSIRDGVVAFSSDGGQIELTIAGAEITDTIYLGFQAAYGPRMNYGFTGTDKLGRKYNQAGFHFVDKAAQKWPQFVAEAIREVRR